MPTGQDSAPGNSQIPEDGHHAAARELLESLPRNPWRLSRRQIDKLVPLAAAALADPDHPWDADDLYEHLNQPPPKGMRSGYGVLRNRLGEDLPLPEPKAPVIDTTPCKLHKDQRGRDCPVCRAELKVAFGRDVDWTGFATPADAWTAWTEETHAA